MAVRAVAWIDDGDWSWFLAPVVDASVAIERVPPAAGLDAALAALSRVGAEILVTGWSTPPLPADLRARAPGLRYLCHLCGTVRRLLPRALIEQGLLVSNWADAHAFTVAEHCLTLLLASMRRIGHFHSAIHHAGGWGLPAQALQPRSLRDRRVGIHGFGAVARELSAMLQPLRCTVTAYAPGDPDEALASRGVARAKTVEELYAGSDALVCLAPLTPQTQGTVDAALLARLPKDAVFVNVGRGLVIDERALAAEAASGRIQVALDVYAEEPLPTSSPLRAVTDAVLTPHVGGPTADQRVACGRLALDNLRAYGRGEPVRGRIDVTRYDSIT